MTFVVLSRSSQNVRGKVPFKPECSGKPSRAYLECFKTNSRGIWVSVGSLNKHAPGKVSFKSNCSWKGVPSGVLNKHAPGKVPFKSNCSGKRRTPFEHERCDLNFIFNVNSDAYVFLYSHRPKCSRLKTYSSLKRLKNRLHSGRRGAY